MEAKAGPKPAKPRGKRLPPNRTAPPAVVPSRLPSLPLPFPVICSNTLEAFSTVRCEKMMNAYGPFRLGFNVIPVTCRGVLVAGPLICSWVRRVASPVLLLCVLHGVGDPKFPGSKPVSEAATKYGPALVSGPVFFIFEKVCTFLPAEEPPAPSEPEPAAAVESASKEITPEAAEEVKKEEAETVEETPSAPPAPAEEAPAPPAPEPAKPDEPAPEPAKA
ncbi:hypothetical protein GW17_00061826 [Ensete ventricosum]|nr:hypothetical protein GW17_00061826 [Ensete ventricosum]